MTFDGSIIYNMILIALFYFIKKCGSPLACAGHGKPQAAYPSGPRQLRGCPLNRSVAAKRQHMMDQSIVASAFLIEACLKNRRLCAAATNAASDDGRKRLIRIDFSEIQTHKHGVGLISLVQFEAKRFD